MSFVSAQWRTRLPARAGGCAEICSLFAIVTSPLRVRDEAGRTRCRARTHAQRRRTRANRRRRRRRARQRCCDGGLEGLGSERERRNGRVVGTEGFGERTGVGGALVGHDVTKTASANGATAAAMASTPCQPAWRRETSRATARSIRAVPLPCVSPSRRCARLDDRRRGRRWSVSRRPGHDTTARPARTCCGVSSMPGVHTTPRRRRSRSRRSRAGADRRAGASPRTRRAPS